MAESSQLAGLLYLFKKQRVQIGGAHFGPIIPWLPPQPAAYSRALQHPCIPAVL